MDLSIHPPGESRGGRALSTTCQRAFFAWSHAPHGYRYSLGGAWLDRKDSCWRLCRCPFVASEFSVESFSIKKQSFRQNLSLAPPRRAVPSNPRAARGEGAARGAPSCSAAARYGVRTARDGHGHGRRDLLVAVLALLLRHVQVSNDGLGVVWLERARACRWVQSRRPSAPLMPDTVRGPDPAPPR